MATEIAEAVEEEVPWVKLGEENWGKLSPLVGSILEFGVVASGLESEDGGHGALLVTGVDLEESSGLIVSGRVVGADAEGLSTELSNKVNRRGFRVHLCSAPSCTYGGDVDLIHVVTGRVHTAANFKAPYMKAWGKRLVSDFIRDQASGFRWPTKEGKGKPAKGGEPPAKRPAGRFNERKRRREPPGVRKEGEQAKKRGKEKKKREEGGRSTEDRLREKLAAFRARVAGGGLGKKEDKEERKVKKEKKARVRDAEEEDYDSVDTEGDSSCAWESGPLPLGSGTKLGSTLALSHRTHQEEMEEKRTGGKKRPSLEPSKPEAQLLAVAAQQKGLQDQTRRRGQKDEKDPGKAKDSEKRKRKKKDRKKRKKSKRKKKKKKKDFGGSSGGSSSSSSVSGRSDRSSWSMKSGSSSDSSLLAPLQRKSKQNPGGVLRMLIKHARQLMDQDTAVDVGEDTGILGGVRMTSYFSLMLRPYYPTTSRDMKELYLLATMIDQLRQGRLGALGDAMGSRFIAIQTAMSEGNWRSAQYLEMHPLDSGTPAPVSLLLEARKHARLIDKSQKQEDYRGKGNWKGHEKGKWYFEDAPKGKGAKGKYGKGKGRGRGQWGQPAGGWDPSGQNPNWWGARREEREKQGKGADPKEEGEKKK